MGCVLLLQEHSVEKRPCKSYWKGDKSRERVLCKLLLALTHTSLFDANILANDLKRWAQK